MTESFEVVTGALTGHSRNLAGLADELQAAFDAARQVSLTADAFGAVARPAALAIDQLGQTGQTTLQSSAGAMDWAMGTIRESVARFDTVETGNTNQFNSRQLAGTLPGPGSRPKTPPPRRPPWDQEGPNQPKIDREPAPPKPLEPDRKREDPFHDHSPELRPQDT